jgi:ABC-type Fe3+ transport system permease subunit
MTLSALTYLASVGVAVAVAAVIQHTRQRGSRRLNTVIAAVVLVILAVAVVITFARQ